MNSFSFLRSTLQKGGRYGNRLLSSFTTTRREHSQTKSDEGIHIVDDYFIPNYEISPLHYRKFKRPSLKQGSMTFVDENFNAKKISFCQKNVMHWIYYANEDDKELGLQKVGQMKYRKWCRDAYKEATSESPRYTMGVGKAMLSWIFLQSCFLSQQDIPEFIQFSKSLRFHGFEDFFKENGIYPPFSNSKEFSIYYHSTSIPPRDISRIGKGVHLVGCFDRPLFLYTLDVAEKGELSRLKCNNLNSDSSMKEYMRTLLASSAWDGPLLKISPAIYALVILEEFLRDMHLMLVNSMMLSSIRNKGERPKSPMNSVKALKDKAKRNYLRKVPLELIIDKNVRGIMVQIMGMSMNDLKRGLSMMDVTERNRCVVVKKMPSFFFGMASPEYMPTVIGDEDSLKDLLMKLGKRGATWCASRIDLNDWMYIAGRVESVGYNPLEREIYIIQPTAQAMAELFGDANAFKFRYSNNGSNDVYYEQMHMFEVLPKMNDDTLHLPSQ